LVQIKGWNFCEETGLHRQGVCRQALASIVGFGNNDDVGEFNENLDDVEMDAAAGERAMESAGVNDFSDLLRNRICEPDDHDRKVVQIQTFHPNLITHSRWKKQGVVEFIPTLHPKFL